MIDRRNFRKVYSRIWTSQDFQSLSGDEKLVAFYLLTGPQTNRIGFFRLSAASAAEEIGITLEVFNASIRRVCAVFGWQWDCQGRVMFIPSWWVFNPLKDNTHNLKGYLTDLNDVPRTHLITAFCANIERIPEAQRHLLNGWEAALTPREAPPGHGQGTVGGTVGDPALTTKTETETETQTETAPPRAVSLAEEVPGKPTAGIVFTGGAPAAKPKPAPHASRAHFMCHPRGTHCIFKTQHEKFEMLIANARFGGDTGGARRLLERWYPTVWAQLDPTHIPEDIFRFWQDEFSKEFATKRVKATTGPPPPRDCKHTPRCLTEAAHTMRYLADQRSYAS